MSVNVCGHGSAVRPVGDKVEPCSAMSLSSHRLMEKACDASVLRPAGGHADHRRGDGGRPRLRPDARPRMMRRGELYNYRDPASIRGTGVVALLVEFPPTGDGHQWVAMQWLG